MRVFVGNQEVVSEPELIELAGGFEDHPHGFFPSLFFGVPGESEEESDARQAAAKGILADLIESASFADPMAGEGPAIDIDTMNLAYATQLASVPTLAGRGRRRSGGRRSKAA